MVHANAVIHGRASQSLTFDATQHPVALQLGGGEPQTLAQAARVGEELGYDEINLNVGCPSSKVQQGEFGACLMASPNRVAECVAAMRAVVRVPVSVKTRTGVDDLDSFDHLCRFASAVAQAGADALIVHARKAWLKGLSPKQNRELPPLDHGRVYDLKEAFPRLPIVINGGIDTLAAALRHLARVDGVMIGRAAYHNPLLLLEVDSLLFDALRPPHTTEEILARYCEYMQRQIALGVPPPRLLRHLLGLFQGLPGARAWRRALSSGSLQPEHAVAWVQAAAARTEFPRNEEERLC